MARANTEMIIKKTIQIFVGKKNGSMETMMKQSKKAELIGKKDSFASCNANLAVAMALVVVAPVVVALAVAVA